MEAISEAAKKLKFADQFAILEKKLTVKQRLDLVKAKLLWIKPKGQGALANAMRAAGTLPPPHLVNPQAHHNMPWHESDWFLAHGIDVNDPQFGRWVEGTPPGQHQVWTSDFNKEWHKFIDDEIVDKVGEGYTRKEVLAQMNKMRNSGNYP